MGGCWACSCELPLCLRPGLPPSWAAEPGGRFPPRPLAAGGRGAVRVGGRWRLLVRAPRSSAAGRARSRRRGVAWREGRHRFGSLASRGLGSASGPGLDPLVRQREEVERRQPPGFASFRNRRQASDEELDATALPDVRRMARQVAQEAAGGEPPDGVAAPSVQWDGGGDWRDLVLGAPAGEVTLSMLVGKQGLRDWAAYVSRTQLAFDAIKGGRRSSGDFVIRSSSLPESARGVVWDTGDPASCRPVRRSDRHTVFPGAKQLDRERFRAIARRLRWEEVDRDIV